MLTFTADNS